MYYYQCCGILLESEFELALPSCASGVSVTDAPAACVRAGIAAPLAAPMMKCLLSEVAPQEYWLEIPGIARYRVCRGREIEVHAAASARVMDVTTYLLSYALAALCCQRGLLVMHATAVAFGQVALVLVGASASGKSTLAAALAQRGARVLCDDLCVINPDSPSPLVYAETGTVTVWADVAEHLGYDTTQLEQPIAGLLKFRLPHDARIEDAMAGVPIHHVLTLSEPSVAQHEVTIERQRPVDALAHFASAGGFGELLEGMGRQQLQLEQCGRVLQRARAWKLSRALSFAHLPATLLAIEDLLRADCER